MAGSEHTQPRFDWQRQSSMCHTAGVGGRGCGERCLAGALRPESRLSKLGPYKILRPLAVGGQAEVLLGELRGPGGFSVRHALKVLKDPLGGQRPTDVPPARALVAEARLLAQLAHPHTLSIHGLDVFDDRLVMVLEYVGGRSLAIVLERLARMGRAMPVEHALWIARCVALALDRAHDLQDDGGRRLNVIHRDVNPQNVLLGFDGRVKLIDFGIAISRIASRDTRLGIVKGKPDFMSPEQAYGVDDIDHRSDIYSLGLVLYEMLTGVRPLAGTTEQALDRARNPNFAPPRSHRPELPAAVDDVATRALDRKPSLRFQSARDMVVACIELLHTQNPSYCGDELSEYLKNLLTAEWEAEQRGGGPREGTQVLPLDEVSAESRSRPILDRASMPSVYDLVPDPDDAHAPPTKKGRAPRALKPGAPSEDLYATSQRSHVEMRRVSASPLDDDDDEPTLLAQPDPPDDEPSTYDVDEHLAAMDDALDLDELLQAIEDIYERRSGKAPPKEPPAHRRRADGDDEESTQVFHRGGRDN